MFSNIQVINNAESHNDNNRHEEFKNNVYRISGIGYYTALDMARRNARVILASPYMQLAEKAKAKIIEATGNQNVVVRFLDLGSMASVRQFVQEIKQESRLDILVNNAGALSESSSLFT